MSITISNTPSSISTAAEFTATSSLSEDSSHVNMRVEASLMRGTTIIAKKVKPVALTAFDFKDVLKSLVLNSTPIPTDTAGLAFQDPGKVGSTNLITSWSNAGFSTWSVSGATWTSVSSATGGCNGVSNGISIAAGKLYVLIASGGTNSANNNLGTIACSTLIGTEYINLYMKNQRRWYFHARENGNASLVLTFPSGTTSSFSGVTWYLYELNSCDWYADYYVSFTEKWETALGVTTTGATLATTSGHIYIKSEESPTTFYLRYSGGSSQSFMLPDGWFIPGIQRSYNFNWNSSLGGFGHTPLWFITPDIAASIGAVFAYYNSAGGADGTASIAEAMIYSPVCILRLNRSIGSYDTFVNLTRDGSIQSSEVAKFRRSKPVPQDGFHIIWQNSAGGESAFLFGNNVLKGMRAEKEFYKDSSGITRLLKQVNSNYIRASAGFPLSEHNLEFFADVLKSTKIRWLISYTNYLECTLISNEIVTSDSLEFLDFEIELEY